MHGQMRIAGGLFAIVTNTTFIKLESKITLASVALPEKKIALTIPIHQIPVFIIHDLLHAVVFSWEVNR